jgi:hypothetical protein
METKFVELKDDDFKPFTIQVTFHTELEALCFAECLIIVDTHEDVADELSEIGHSVEERLQKTMRMSKFGEPTKL